MTRSAQQYGQSNTTAPPHTCFPTVKRRPALHRVLKICLATLLITACSRTENTMSQDLSTAAAEADVENGGRGLAKLNPQPRQAFDVVLKLHNAPGPFERIEAVAQYDVANEAECGRINPATGTAGRITSQEPVALKRVADDEYHGTVYLDQMLDEDYYGRGVCQWKFSGTGALLKATGAHEETRFLTFIDADRFTAGDTLTRHYLKMDYPRVGIVQGPHGPTALEDYPASGDEDPNSYKAELRDALFSISLSAKKARQ
ncbi:MAG: hypothetical protein ABWY09_03370 [Stenotrophomonas maltophilia]